MTIVQAIQAKKRHLNFKLLSKIFQRNSPKLGKIPAPLFKKKLLLFVFEIFKPFFFSFRKVDKICNKNDLWHFHGEWRWWWGHVRCTLQQFKDPFDFTLVRKIGLLFVSCVLWIRSCNFPPEFFSVSYRPQEKKKNSFFFFSILKKTYLDIQ